MRSPRVKERYFMRRWLMCREDFQPVSWRVVEMKNIRNDGWRAVGGHMWPSENTRVAKTKSLKCFLNSGKSIAAGSAPVAGTVMGASL